MTAIAPTTSTRLSIASPALVIAPSRVLPAVEWFFDSIKSWGLHLAKSKCHAKARVAVARKLAVVMHAMWRDGTVYTGDAQMTDSERAAAVASKERRISYAKS